MDVRVSGDLEEDLARRVLDEADHPKALAARADHLRVNPSDPEEATALGLDERLHRLRVASVGFFSGDALVRCVRPRLEAQEVEHHDGLVGRAGQQALDLLRGWVSCHRGPPSALSAAGANTPHGAPCVVARTMPQEAAVATGARRASEPASDGRVRRGERSGQAIVEALVGLVGDGILEPTAQQVAARAGVGIRTVFRRFSDMESLFAEMGARVQADVLPLLAGEPGGAVAERARALVAR